MPGDTYDKFTLCFKEETSCGTTLITDTNAIAYLLGIVSKKAELPDPEVDVYRHPPAAASRNPSAIQKVKRVLNSSFYVAPVNGILYYLAWGACSTVGSDPYTHTITRGAALPCVTLHHESEDSGSVLTDLVRQYKGTKIGSISLMANFETPFLHSEIAWVAKDAAKVAFTLTNAPGHPSGSSTSVFAWPDATKKWGGTDISEHIIGFKLVNINNVIPLITQQSAGPATVFTLVDGVAYYELELDLVVDRSDYWDNLLLASEPKEVEIKFTRDTDDYLKITCSGCKMIGNPTPHPVASGLEGKIVLEPETVTIEVKDSISDYTEI